MSLTAADMWDAFPNLALPGLTRYSENHKRSAAQGDGSSVSLLGIISVDPTPHSHGGGSRAKVSISLTSEVSPNL